MLESMGRKNILVNLTVSKENIKNAPKKIKKYVTKQIKILSRLERYRL